MKKLTYIFLVVAFLFTSTVGTIPVAQAVNKDYRLIKTGDNPMVYLVKNDRRIHIPNEEVFEAGGYSWGDIEIIPEKEMVSIPNTGLIKSKIDSKVYAITDGKKEWIPDEETFLDSDYEWEDIVLINEAQINFYPDTQKAGNKNQPTKITLSDTSEQKKDVVKKKEKRTYNLGSGNGGGGNSLTVPFTPTESDKVTIQNEEPEIVVDKEEVVAEKPRKDIVNVAQTDWSKVDWDEKTVLLSDLDKYKEKIDLLLEKGDGTQAKNLKPERHTMSSDEALEELSVPSKVSEIVKEYREKTGMFQKIKDEKNAKKILGAYIKSATPEVPKMEKKVNEMDHFVDISTQGKKMKGVELKPFSGKEKPEIKVEIKSKFEKVKRHRLEDVTIRGIEKKVKTRGLSLSVSVKTNEEKTLGKKILSYFGKLFGIEEVVAEDVTPIIEYYNGIEANTLDNALYYLSLIQNDDGTFGNITKYEETAEVALMLGDIRRTDNTQFNDALNYLIAEEPKNNREKAIKARLMVGLGLPYESYLNELVVDKNDNHGYPLHSGYQSDILTSMETVLAMYTGNYSIQGEMPLALYYVLNNIPEDGALRYTPNSLPSYYLINKIAQYLQPFRSMNIANDEGVDISVQDKIDNLLGYLSSQFDLENEKLLGTDDTIDEIMTFRTWQMYGVENNYQEILEEKLIEDQYVNGSFDNSTRATTYSVKALQKPDLVLTNFVSTGNLESRQAANFELTIENRGHAPSVGGTIYLFTDNCDTGTRLELDPSAFTVEPNQTVNLGINISETNRLTQDVNFKLYYENSEDLNYDNNWIQEDFNFVAASDGTPALPMYYAAFKYELNNNPAVIVTLPALRKDDPNRGAYALLYKESSNSQWGYTNYDPNLYIIGYFPEGGYYDFTVGVWNAEMTQITYFTDYTSIHLSADDELYTGSVSGRLTLDNENFPDEYITMQSGLSGSTDENGEFNRSGGANGRLATWVEEEYYDEIRTTFTVIEGQTTENIRIFTHLKEDNEAPEIGFFELRWLNNMVARTEGEYTLFAASSDNVKVKDADFYLWHPQEEYWEYLGNDATYGDTKTLEWYIPSDLPLGTDYKVRAISYDYRGNASEPVEWGPFEVINGIPPEVEVLSPNGGEEWYLGTTGTIQWEADSFYGVGSIYINYIYPNRDSRIVSNIPNTGEYEWSIPLISNYISDQVKIEVRAGDSVSNQWSEDLSDDFLSILDNSSLPEKPWGEPTNLTKDDIFDLPGGNLNDLIPAVDSQGNVHVLYYYNHDTTVDSQRIITQQFYHRFLQTDGTWSELEKLYENIINTDASLNGYYRIQDLKFLIDENDNYHVLWQKSLSGGCETFNDSQIFYIHYDGSAWSDIENLSNTVTYSRSPDMFISGNTVQTIWSDGVTYDSECSSTGYGQLHHKEKVNGTWQNTEIIPTDSTASWAQIAQGSDNTLHVVFYRGGDDKGVYHTYRDSGSWSEQTALFIGSNDYNDLAIGSDNSLHFAFRQWYTDPETGSSRARIMYSSYKDNIWSTAVETTPIIEDHHSERPRLVVDNNNDPHLFWRHTTPGSRYQAAWSTYKNGNWTDYKYYSLGSQSINDSGAEVVYNPITNKLFSTYGTWYSFTYHMYYNEADLNVDYIPPQPINNLVGEFTGGITLNWDLYENIDNDFDHFNFYRAEETEPVSFEDFTLLEDTESSVTSTSYTDIDIWADTDFYYTATVVDTGGLESEPAPWVGPFQLIPPPVVLPTELLIEQETSPIDLETNTPVFSSIYNTDDNFRSTNAQIRIATDSEFNNLISTSEDISLTSDLVMAYNFDDSKFPTETEEFYGKDYLLVEDMSNNNRLGYIGTMGDTIPTWSTEGIVGTAAHFNGENHMMIGEAGLNNTNTISTEIWVKTEGKDGIMGIINPMLGIHSFISLFTNNNSLQARFYASQTDYLRGPNIADNEWHQIILTWDGEHSRMYVDGVLEDEKVTVGTRLSGSQNGLFVGRMNPGTTEEETARHFVGAIDEALFYTKTLSAEEIADHYNRVVGENHVAGLCNSSDRCADVSYENTNLSLSDGDVTYYTQMRYKKENGEYSDWSEETHTFSLMDYDFLTTSNLEVNKKTNPISVNAPVSFSAEVISANHDSLAKQARIQVATDEAFTNLVWDSTSLDLTNGATTMLDFASINSSLELDAILDKSDNNRNATLGLGVAEYAPIWSADGLLTNETTSDGTYTFDGLDDRIHLAETGLQDINTISTEMWVRTNGKDGIAGLLYTDHSTNNFLRLYTANNQLKARIYASQTDELTGPVINDSQWHHVVLTWDGEYSRMYVDGILEDEKVTIGDRMSGSQYGLYIGNFAPASYDDKAWNGDIDEVALYNKTLTPEEVLYNYENAPNGLHNGSMCLVFYPCRNINYNLDGNATNDLEMEQTYFWRMLHIDSQGSEGPWSSESASFTMQEEYSSLPTELRINNLENPTDTTKPVFFSSKFHDIFRTSKASYASIQVSTDENFTNLVWNSNPFDLTKGATTIHNFHQEITTAEENALEDVSGNNRNATLGDGNVDFMPTWFPDGIINGAYAFDGVDDRIHLSETGLEDINTISTEMWVKTDGKSGIAGLLHTDHGKNNLLNLYTSNNTLVARIYTSQTDYLRGPNIADNQWHHIALTWDGAYSRMYVDGVMVDEKVTIGTRMSGSQYGLYIGNFAPAYHDNLAWHGELDEIALYDKTLTLDEIQNNYQSGLAGIHSAGMCEAESACGNIKYSEDGLGSSLENNTQYWWRINYLDTQSRESGWSEESAFFQLTSE